MMNRPPPSATCRIQLRQGVDFDEVARRLPYLAEIGITHLYLSPIFTAVPGSTSGYDCTDPNEVEPTLGGEEGFRALCAEVSARDMGILLDIVPNHLAASPSNPFWHDMLRDGPGSSAARVFDVDWEARAGGTPGKLLLPILANPIAQELAENELVLEARDPAVLSYRGNILPLANDSLRPDLLETLERQHWRLVWWRSGDKHLNWRRFFDISTLAGVRIEDPEVLARTHAKLFELLSIDAIHGLRVDHVDGLADPGAYLVALDAAWRARRDDPPWILVEKILAVDEMLHEDWPVAGSSGYEALNRIHAVFIDPAGLDALETTWRSASAEWPDFETCLADSKRQILGQGLAADLERLARMVGMHLIVDQPLADIREGLVRVAIATDRYRSYGAQAPQAFDAAFERVDWSGLPDSLPVALRAAIATDSELRRRFEQLSAPAMAKSMEDTAFYRWTPLLSRNEVGNDPGHPLPTIAQLHDQFADSAVRHPRALLATATHDAKRGEDARMRISMLSHPAFDWPREVEQWFGLAWPLTRNGEPDRASLYLIFQTLVGAWPSPGAADPDLPERLDAYFEKAFREAKRHTAWLAPDEHFEQRVRDFIALLLARSPLVERVVAFVGRIDPAARAFSLGQMILRSTLPGIPDLYHGSERQDLSLVDPDNRRPVDLDALLHVLHQSSDDWRVDGAKQRLMQRVLCWRRDHAAFMASASYHPIEQPEGAGVFAYERRGSAGRLLVVVTNRVDADGQPRTGSSALPLAVGPDGHSAYDVLRERTRALPASCTIAELLDDWPVAVVFLALAPGNPSD